MLIDPSLRSRRNLLRGGVALAASAFFAPGVFADMLDRTPHVDEGPYYPYNKIPLDSDNDLIIVNNSLTPAVGEITHLGGKVVDRNGSPVKDALIEIWQCDAKQVYLAERPKDKQDGNFQGYGKFTTDSTGAYRFRTIKPVEYPGRPAPHIHFKVIKGGEELLMTQLFIRGYANNMKDSLFRNMRDPIERELVSTDFKPMKDSKIGEHTATFEIVIGRTPADPDPAH